MTGTWLSSIAKLPNNSKRVINIRAYDEGVQYRLGGNDTARPQADNPHPDPSSNKDAWDAGWLDAKAGTIDASSAYRGLQGPL